MYHIVFKKENYLLPTGVTLKADNSIEALNIFEVIHPGAQFMIMYKVNECNGELEW
jgi:hypothetical protein